MNEINKQVSRARRRVNTGKFFSILTWAAFAGLLLAVVGMAIPKIWHLDFLQTQNHVDAWTYSWILGGAVFGFLVACTLTWRCRASQMDVAVEVDKRFGLKERLSSAMSLAPEDAESRAGKALVEDAVSRAESIDVRDEFRYQPTWRALLPLIPILLLIVLVFVPNAEKKVSAAVETNAEARKKVSVAIKEFKKKIEEKRNELATKGLKDAKEFKTLSKKFEDLLDDKNNTKKDAMVKLNDIKKQIEERRKKLGNSKELRESLNKLKDVSQGPAKKLADAMSKGDMEEAKKAIKELVDKLKSGDLNKVELAKLAKDIEQMAKELKKLAAKHEAEKKKLENEIKKALEKGDLEKAAKLQDQLDKKKELDKQKEKMKKMAEQLKKCAECMKKGGEKSKDGGKPKSGKSGEKAGEKGGEKSGEKGGEKSAEEAEQAMKEAGEALEDLAEDIEEMRQSLEELEALEDLEDAAEASKAKMAGGDGEGDKPGWSDFAKGKGKGGGIRDREEENTGTFRARVKGKLQKGQTVKTGTADGKNITGRSASETRELVKAGTSKDSDPLENQKLSKTQREHAQQYFEALRKNN
ncbi:MAG: hypothetical protein AB8B55_05075 [Mariniblastus sp.]